jgi:D-3-phosphoglycerate dehydrogenase
VIGGTEVFHVVQISTGYSDGSLERGIIEEAGGTFSLVSSEDASEIVRAAKKADGLIVTLTDINERMMDALPHLKLIVRAGIGVDNIDLDAAKMRGIRVCNLPFYCQEEVADHTVAMLLCLERKIYLQVQDVKNGNWFKAKKYHPMNGLQGATIGFVGFGGIARKVYARLIPFGMKAVAYDPYINRQSVKKIGVTVLQLEELLGVSDYVSLHLPLTAESKHLFNHATIRKMKKGACLINTARGALVDNDALLEAIETNYLAGAALDVIEGDLEATLIFREYPNVLITPHSAYYGELSNLKIRSQAGETVAAFFQGREMNNVVV